VILTMGANGAMHRDQTGRKTDIPAYRIDVERTCGRGDSLSAGGFPGMQLWRSIGDGIRFGQATSVRTAIGFGSRAVLSSLEDITAFTERTPTRG
jgi:sugar/nucleoside kinase (ribokinase family)